MKPVSGFLVLLFSGQVSVQAQFSLQSPAAGKKALARLLGVWGTTEQCAAHARAKTDDPRLYPYRTSDQWLVHGGIYCYLFWQNSEQTGEHYRALALARCGDDSLRDYRLLLTLQQRKLRVHWSDDFTTRALEAC